MKKFLLILFMALTGFSLEAQSVKLFSADAEITTDTIVVKQYDTESGYESFLTSSFKLENTSGFLLDLGIKVYYVEHIEGTGLQVCAAGNCVVVNQKFYEFSNTISLPANQTLEGVDGIHDGFNAGNNWFVTSGIVRYTIYNKRNVSDSSSVVVKYYKETGTTGIQETNRVEGVYPNPANNFLTIDYSFSIENVVAEVYTVIGAKIRTIEIDHTQNRTNLETNNLPNGLYYVRFNSNGKSIHTERFVVNHN